jgi:CRISPR-associated protein Cas1
MIKRTIDISNGPTYLAIENDQLVLSREGAEVGRIPCEDIGILLIDHYATVYTHVVMTRLMGYGAVVVLCGEKHLPTGLVLPMEGNDLMTQRLLKQIECSAPLRKRLWQQVVRAKVRGQAENLKGAGDGGGEKLDGREVARRRLLNLAEEVRSGDPENAEGQAARFYWPALMGDGFRRDRFGDWPNALLNYGYMVMRASVARALVGAGLHPAFGLHHQNRGNAFCLADDLVEPLRPLVDAAVVRMLRPGLDTIGPEVKRAILGLLTVETKVGDQSGPLMVGLHRMAASLWQCYAGERTTIELPEFTTVQT